MKFNMGCGHNRRDGYVNVDSQPGAAADETWDLEQTPWPWPDGCAEEVLFMHALEHMGGDPKVFLAIMQELYRICAPGARVIVHVPHPRHDDYLNDPTHVRAITPAILGLFDRQANDRWRAAGDANTPLAHYTGVDFVIAQAHTVLEEPYASQLKAGELAPADVARALKERNNIAKEFRIQLVARKE